MMVVSINNVSNTVGGDTNSVLANKLIYKKMWWTYAVRVAFVVGAVAFAAAAVAVAAPASVAAKAPPPLYQQQWIFFQFI